MKKVLHIVDFRVIMSASRYANVLHVQVVRTSSLVVRVGPARLPCNTLLQHLAPGWSVSYCDAPVTTLRCRTELKFYQDERPTWNNADNTLVFSFGTEHRDALAPVARGVHASP